MGATLSLQNFRSVLRRPVPVLIGLASQFGWMPLIAYSLALALDKQGEVHAWGSASSMRRVPNTGLENVVAIAGGTHAYAALKKDATLLPWGTYMGRKPDFPHPDQLIDVQAVACGENRLFVLKKNGEILFSHPGGAELPDKPDGLEEQR